MKRAASLSALLLTVGLAACSTVATLDLHQEDADISESGDPEGGDRFYSFSTNIPKGAAVEVYNVTVGLNCRTGPATNYMVVRLLAKGEQGTVLDTNATRKWYKLDIAGTQCWSYHYYLRQTTASGNGQSVGGNTGGSAASPAPDTSMSCVNHCGQRAPGGCYCDIECSQHGDCCTNMQSTCGTAPQTPNTPQAPNTPAPNATDSCQGHCGQQAQSGCYCDGQCAQFGDCCADSQSACGTPAGGGAAPQPAPANPKADNPVSNPNGFSGMTSSYVLSRNGIINASKAFVGFSYWWGGGRFPKPWQTSGKSHGKCWKSGGYHHSGTYGADCSGFVSKVWQLPEAISFETNAHPFNTSSFRYNTTHWTNISRSAAQRGDALVYRGSTGGHIVIFSSGDAWGSMKTYEARGCSYGVVYNTRTFGTSYRARKRKGL
ncbi:MAG: C40 family peptidase [Deltaproteobacteria bacterium]|nr:C40 family peptidase [Deltaproteobacteria bacterium]